MTSPYDTDLPKTPANYQPLTPLSFLQRAALATPDAVAIIHGNARITYRTFYDRARQLGSPLSGRGIGVGDTVSVMLANTPPMLEAHYGVGMTGGVLHTINTRLDPAIIAFQLDHANTRLLITDREFSSVIKAALELATVKPIIIDYDDKEFPQSGEALSDIDYESFIAAGDPLFEWRWPADEWEAISLNYTSGTTGAPKGACITPKMLHWNSINTTLRLNLSQSDVFVSFLPFFHTGGWNVLLTPFLHRGARIVLMKKFDADRILELCEKEGATILFGVPTTMEMMAHSRRFHDVQLAKVRYAIVGGEPMSIELIKTWQEKGVPIRQGFGLTEFGPNVFSLNETDAIRKIGSIGFPNFYISTKVVDDHGKEVGPGEIGELLLSGPVCTPGYWKNEKATKESIVDGWFHTGDLVRFDEEGYFYVAGRKKDMFISGGENVYPVEVERVLSQLPAIREVAVIGVPDAKWGEVGCACVSVVAGTTLTEDEVIRFCADKLAKYKIPKRVQFFQDLPKGDSGKILKRELRLNLVSI